MNDLVSCVITTYNRELNILKRAINSVLNQTYKNIELIIVNDCPENRKINHEIEEYIDGISGISGININYVLHKENKGACAARNTGIRLSKGKYIGFLDDDDEWVDTKIEHQIKLFNSENVGAVYCFYNNISLTGESRKIIPCTFSGNLVNNLLRGNCIGGTSMPLICKNVFENIGIFDEEMMSSQDHDMWLRISKEYDINCCCEFLVNRYMQNESITYNMNKQRQGFELFLLKNKEFYEKDPKIYNYIVNQKAKQWFRSKYFHDAFTLYKKAVEIKPLSIYNLSEPIKAVYLLLKDVIK